jgi:hypothetical protein
MNKLIGWLVVAGTLYFIYEEYQKTKKTKPQVKIKD